LGRRSPEIDPVDDNPASRRMSLSIESDCLGVDQLQRGLREDDDSIVRWIPPWSLTDRMRWAKEHPWVAACYFGFYLSLVFIAAAFVVPPLFGITVTSRFAVGLALAITPIVTLLVGLALRGGWAERHGLAPDNPPNLRRPLSTLPDRRLTALAWISSAAILITGLDLVIGPMKRPITFISLALWVGCLALVTHERRHRRGNHGEGPSLPPQSDM
jgi:hypothetical protein